MEERGCMEDKGEECDVMETNRRRRKWKCMLEWNASGMVVDCAWGGRVRTPREGRPRGTSKANNDDQQQEAERVAKYERDKNDKTDLKQ